MFAQTAVASWCLGRVEKEKNCRCALTLSPEGSVGVKAHIYYFN